MLNMAKAPRRPTYAAFTESVRIPFTDSDSVDSTPSIAINVSGKVIPNVGIDSGSTIFALSDWLVPDFPEEQAEIDKLNLKPGEIEYVGASKWKGYWFPVKVTFLNVDEALATSELDVLVIVEQFDKNGNLKPEEKQEPVHYMGIRFGREIEPDLVYSPDKNALLTVKTIKGIAIDPKSFRTGYILHRRSLEIGLTAENTKSFQCTELTKTHHSDIPFYWDPPTMEVSIKDHVKESGWILGELLVDTGLAHMQIGSPQYIENPSITKEDLPGPLDVAIRFSPKIRDPPLAHPAVENPDLEDPREDLPAVEYAFHWPGKGEAGLPHGISYYRSGKDSFVNTGKHIHDRFDTMFDAVGGYWGIRKI